MASAWESHFAFPSFSVIEPRSRNTCVTVILDTDDWLEIFEAGVDRENGLRSKVVLVGDVRLCCDKDGEKVAGLEDAPPPPLPPPPPPP
jgi:hypothetical protein